MIVNNPHKILCLAALLSAGLAQPSLAGEVRTQTGTNIDLSQYKTYQWLPPRVLTQAGVVEDHPANPILKEVVGRQLAQKRLNELADGADLQIQVYVLTESVPQLEAVLMGGEAGMFYATPIATMGRYNRQGTLYINLIDRRAKRSAWLGMATESLPSGTLKPDEIHKKLDHAATSIFKKYPARK